MNWMRANLAWMASQRVRTVSVLASPEHAFEQHVAARQQADQDALDHVGLADDHLADLVHQAVDEGALFGDEFIQGTYVVHSVFSLKGDGWPLCTTSRAGARVSPVTRGPGRLFPVFQPSLAGAASYNADRGPGSFRSRAHEDPEGARARLHRRRMQQLHLLHGGRPRSPGSEQRRDDAGARPLDPRRAPRRRRGLLHQRGAHHAQRASAVRRVGQIAGVRPHQRHDEQATSGCRRCLTRQGWQRLG